MKQCTKCKETKPLERFTVRRYKNGTQSHTSWCKGCVTKAAKRRQREYLAAGMCGTGCGEPLKPGHKNYCIAHATRIVRKNRERKAQGKCTYSWTCEEPIAEFGTSQCATHMEQEKWQRIKRAYGLERHEFEQMLTSQNDRCPVTGDILLVPTHGKNEVKGADSFNRFAVVDHCHTTGRTRDILSNRANVILGLLEEDPKLIRRVADGLISYLEKWAADKAA